MRVKQALNGTARFVSDVWDNFRWFRSTMGRVVEGKIAPGHFGGRHELDRENRKKSGAGPDRPLPARVALHARPRSQVADQASGSLLEGKRHGARDHPPSFSGMTALVGALDAFEGKILLRFSRVWFDRSCFNPALDRGAWKWLPGRVDVTDPSRLARVIAG